MSIRLSLVTAALFILASGCEPQSNGKSIVDRKSLAEDVWMVADAPEELRHLWGEIEGTGEFLDDFTFGMRCVSRDKEILLLFDNQFVGNPFDLNVGDRFRFSAPRESVSYNDHWGGYYFYGVEITPVDD